MARSVPRSTLHQLRTLYAAGTAAGLADGELLERFVERGAGDSPGETERAEAAFAALVDRHGAMVWGTCLRVLGNTHEAEDAFQATFLILARRAGSVRAETLARWLYGVARKVARRARRQAERRRSIPGLLPSRAPGDPASQAELDDLRAAVREELGRLRAEFRAAIELCHLQGLTQDEAARRLHCSRRTVKSRLSAGRRRLRARLARRGFAPAAVPIALLRSTVRTAMFSATGEAGAFPASIAALAMGATRAMFLNKLMFAVVLVLAATGAAVHAVQRDQPADPAGSSDVVKPEAENSPEGPPPADKPAAQLSGQAPGDYDRALSAQGVSAQESYKDAQRLVEDIHRLETRGQRDAALEQIQRLQALAREWERSIHDGPHANVPGEQSAGLPNRAGRGQARPRYAIGGSQRPQALFGRSQAGPDGQTQGARNNIQNPSNSFFGQASRDGAATATRNNDQERRIQRLESLIEQLLNERRQPGEDIPRPPAGRR